MKRILFFVHLLFFSITAVPQRWKWRSTSTTTKATTEGNYIFEGVDYDQLPQEDAAYHNDCYGHYHRCIRSRSYFVPVCVYDISTWYYYDYNNHCEVELKNCKHRVKKGYGIYGTAYTNDVVYFNGEERNCKYYYRRVSSSEEMDRLYFGVDSPPFRSKATPDKYLRNGLTNSNSSGFSTDYEAPAVSPKITKVPSGTE